MPDMGKHSPDTVTIPPKRDHKWVLVLVAACALLEVFPTWVSAGAASGFPVIGHHGLPTDWVLAVVVEAYWGYALYGWLAAPAGRRSSRFAMWSAAGVLVLSLTGQGWYHLAAARAEPLPGALVVFASSLPVLILALVAVLVHLRQLDRAEAEALAARAEEERRRIAREAAAADERTALRAELEAARRVQAERDEAATAALEAERAALEPLRADLADANSEREKLAAKVELLTRKLARSSGQKRTRKSPPKKPSVSTPNNGGSSTLETTVPDDVDTQAEALRILAEEPDISGSELGRRLGKTERYGCILKKSLANAAADGQS